MKLWQSTIGGVCLTAALLGLLAGCGTLQPGGVYQSDEVLYRADQTIVSSYDVLHAFVKWEYANRPGLSGLPEIKRAADHVRRNAKQWISTAVVLREAYAADPTPDNERALTRSINVLRAALVEATGYLARSQAGFSTATPPSPPDFYE